MKKYKYESIIFLLGAIYMILELVCSRILAPYFGTSNLVWTSVIGIILLSSSIGNYIGGIIADKNSSKKTIQFILFITGISILGVGIFQKTFLSFIILFISDIKIGAILSTILLFFIPSMLIGSLSPILIKVRLENSSTIGKTSGLIYALSTLGSIVGTFAGGFLLLPSMGSVEILYLLSICVFLITILINIKDFLFLWSSVFLILINIFALVQTIKINNINKSIVQNNTLSTVADYDTMYSRVRIYNTYDANKELLRYMEIGKGLESSTFLDENKKYELSSEYTKYYDLMFKSNIDINNTLMIGGAGFSYPKYFISHYLDKNMDVVEIDEKVTELAKIYFFLDDLYKDFDLAHNNRLNIITADGRIYLNNNEKKYDAILNDAFSGLSPATTLTTVEAATLIHDSLNTNGVYLSNIVSAINGDDSKFLKSEVATLNNIFKNVYIIPCEKSYNLYSVQNIMVLATDDDLYLDNTISLNYDDSSIILTDNYSPVDSLTPVL